MSIREIDSLLSNIDSEKCIEEIINTSGRAWTNNKETILFIDYLYSLREEVKDGLLNINMKRGEGIYAYNELIGKKECIDEILENIKKIEEN